jgi:acyl-CoA synthetase (AMP-forming)/AMP-acid ligase II
VVPLAHPRFGQEVAALVCVRDGTTVSLEGLREHCHGSLARFKLPRRLAVVAELPRTSAGKPDYVRALSLFGEG